MADLVSGGAVVEATEPVSAPAENAQPEDTRAAFEHAYSEGFATLLEKAGLSLFVTTYQAGKLIVMRASGGKVQTLLRTFDQPMGLAINDRQMTLGTRDHVWFFRNAPDIAPQMEPAGRYDTCYLPRQSFVTGDIRIHEIGWVKQELWMVNTRFSCLCTLDPKYSFVPRWKPPFITALAAEDRCHLNGAAFDPSGIRYVTALGATDKAGGWRDNKVSGGIVMDVPSGEIVVRNLCMPHSPRLVNGQLYLLDSGRGHLITADPKTGKTEKVAEVPGYARGLAIAGNFAFIGLSQIRESNVFGGMPIAESGKELKCGVWVVDIKRGQTVGFVEFRKGVAEIFDVKLLGGKKFPTVLGFQKNTVQGVFVLPSEKK